MDKKITYSKIIPIVTGILFIITLAFTALCLTKMTGYSDNYTIYITALTSTGGLFGTSIIWYMKKAQAENTYKLDMQAFKSKSEVELIHFEKMLELKKKYAATDEIMFELKNDSSIDEMTEQSFQKMQNNIDNQMQDANSQIEIQNIS